MIGALFGTVFLWIISAVAVVALIGLIIVMAQQKKFIGPRVLADDLRDRFDRIGRDEDDVENRDVTIVGEEQSK